MENERSDFIKMHRCTDCGGTLVFRPEKGRLVCEYCDAEFDVPQDEVQAAPSTATPNAAAMLNNQMQGAPVQGMPNQGMPAQTGAMPGQGMPAQAGTMPADANIKKPEYQ